MKKENDFKKNYITTLVRSASRYLRPLKTAFSINLAAANPLPLQLEIFYLMHTGSSS